MTHRPASCTPVLVLTVSLVSSVAGAAPLSNPVLGPTPAPVTLEYFTSLGCPACEQFERDVLPGLLAEADAGQLRVVVGELPAPEPSLAHRALSLLCLATGPGYLERRAELKRPGVRAQASPTGCLHDPAAQGVLDFNAAIFRARGFQGTPAFVLISHRDGAPASQRSWAGRTSWSDWQSELVRLQPTPSEVSP
jgi:hypothetical protein